MRCMDDGYFLILNLCFELCRLLLLLALWIVLVLVYSGSHSTSNTDAAVASLPPNSNDFKSNSGVINSDGSSSSSSSDHDGNIQTASDVESGLISST